MGAGLVCTSNHCCNSSQVGFIQQVVNCITLFWTNNLCSKSEEVVHTSLSVTAMSRVQQNLLFSSTYPQPIFNLLGVVMEHFGLWQGL